MAKIAGVDDNLERQHAPEDREDSDQPFRGIARSGARISDIRAMDIIDNEAAQHEEEIEARLSKRERIAQEYVTELLLHRVRHMVQHYQDHCDTSEGLQAVDPGPRRIRVHER